MRLTWAERWARLTGRRVPCRGCGAPCAADVPYCRSCLDAWNPAAAVAWLLDIRLPSLDD